MIIYAGSVGTPAALGKKGSKGSISGCGEGVYTLEWDGASSLKVIDTSIADNAGIITKSSDGRFLYAANESKDFGGLNGSGGGVTAFAVDAETGKLTKLNDSVSYGARTSYVSVTESGKYLLATNHGSHSTVTCHVEQDEKGNWKIVRGFDDSTLAAFRLNEDGSIQGLSDLKKFEGHGYWCHGGGQSTSHLHSVKVRKDLIFCGNRGADLVEVVRLNEEDGTLHVLNRYHTKPGYAPRHSDFHPTQDLLYVVNENYPCLTVYWFDPEDGSMRELQTVQSMPDEYYAVYPVPNHTKDEADPDEKNTCGMADRRRVMPSDIHVSHDGKHVYVSNRCFMSEGSIASYKVLDDGTLQYLGVTMLGGKDPRGFNITPDDRYLIVSIMEQNLVRIYELDEETGMPDKVIAEAQVNSAASFAF